MPLTEDRRAEVAARQEQDRTELMEKHPTDHMHPHLLTLKLHQAVIPEITCPGKEHCALWYGTDPGVEGQCGLALEASEVGSEFLEWQRGPEFTPAANPFPIGFTWSGGSEDEPPEVEWWRL